MNADATLLLLNRFESWIDRPRGFKGRRSFWLRCVGVTKMRVMHSWELESDMRAKYPKLFLFELVSLNFGDEISLRRVECNTPEI